MDAVPELDERVAIEPEERDVAADRLVDERLGRRAERLSLGEADQALHLGCEIEEELGVVRRDEVVDERDGHPAGLQPDRLLSVFEDAVVLPDRAGRARLAVAHIGTGQVLELERDVLGDVPHPGPLAEPGDEAATTAERAGVILERRQQRDQRVGEVRQRVRRVPLEHAEVDEQADDRLARPVVRAAQHARLDDPQAGLGSRRRARGRAAPASGGPGAGAICRLRLPGSGCGSRLRHDRPPASCGHRVYRLARQPMTHAGLWSVALAALERGRTMACAMTVKSAPGSLAGSFGPNDQEIKFCRSPDGVRLAYAIHGSGPPIVVASCWLSHLQYDWQSPVWRHFLDQLGSLATVVRYDERGFGLSDWDVDDFSLAARLGDLEAITLATGFERFAVLGMSGGSGVALAYAIAHPERVSRLILNGTVCGEPVAFSPDELAEEETYRSMIRVGWAKEDPAFRRVFTTRFIPDATEEQMCWFDDLQRMSTSPANAVASRIARQQVDLEDDLPKITAPTIVLQSIGDRSNTFDNAVSVSSLIPGARLVPLQSRNHILLADEPAWGVFIDEVEQFLEPERRAQDHRARERATEALSRREIEVLRLAADGRTNEEIADALTLSVRTVERHLSNVYAKLGLSGRAARAAAVADYLRQELA